MYNQKFGAKLLVHVRWLSGQNSVYGFEIAHTLMDQLANQEKARFSGVRAGLVTSMVPRHFDWAPDHVVPTSHMLFFLHKIPTFFWMRPQSQIRGINKGPQLDLIISF